MKRFNAVFLAVLLWAWPARPQNVNLVALVSKPISRTIDLPGEFLPFQSVAIHAKVRGYVERVLVDRGSVVKRGALLAELSAPEMSEQISEAEAKFQAAEADRLQAVAQLAALEATLDRLKEASATPGAIAGNELVQAQKQVEAGQALVNAKQQASSSASAFVRGEKDLASYLRITAPFDGIVTDRLVHPGALVGPSADPVLLVIQELSHLRLVISVPEENVGGVSRGGKLDFRVPAYPERTYSGIVARLSHTLDEKTRTMAVELDVLNRDGSLSPGMYPTVKWAVHDPKPALLAPKTSVVTTTERTFVIADESGRAKWVDVRKGTADGDLVQVFGDLKPGELILRRATDETRPGTALK
jgi:membrane fusion protein, multidrug efflux system